MSLVPLARIDHLLGQIGHFRFNLGGIRDWTMATPATPPVGGPTSSIRRGSFI
jgi:hypothetical protein